MFKFLKDKLSKAVGLFSKKVEEESQTIEQSKEQKKENIEKEDMQEISEKIVSQNEYVIGEELEELEKELEESQEPAQVETDETVEAIVNSDLAESDMEIEHEEESFEQALIEKEEQDALEQSKINEQKKLYNEDLISTNKLSSEEQRKLEELDKFEQQETLKEKQKLEEQAKFDEQKRSEEKRLEKEKQKELALKRREEELLKARLAQEEKERQVQEHKKQFDQKQREEKEKKRLEEDQIKREAEERLRLEEQQRLEAERKRILEVEEKEKNKGGFFKKLFSKSKPSTKPATKIEVKTTPQEKQNLEVKSKLVLEKEEYDEVKEDYMLASETEEELEALPIAEKKTFEKLEVQKKEEQEKPEEKKQQKQAVSELDRQQPAKGFFEKIKESITSVKLSEEKFDEIFWDLELAMLENNVAVEVIEKIKADLKEDLTSGKVSRSSVDEIIHDSLKKSIEGLFAEAQQFNLIDRINQKSDKPYIISFIGVNGAGKTTTMAKVAHLLLKNNLTVVFAASDTFRAAAMQQLQEHADKLGVKMIKHDYESDPAAVAFDAIKHAQAKNIDVVLIDTAGRLHTNDNLMNELKKLIRVNKPDMKIFIGEAITGNDCVEQAKLFNEIVGLDAIILAKADIDEKGGAALSVSYVTKKPILYLGTGQTYDDLEEFDSVKIVENIGL